MVEPLAQYPFHPKSMLIRGHRLSYLDEGSGHPLVMVHGNPSWSYLYRNLVQALRGQYRCLVPDHIGCGFSDKPQDYAYRLADHIDNLELLLDTLEIKQCTLVVHDWGGAIGLGWAGRHPERVRGVVVLNTAAFPSSRLPLRIAVCRWPGVGALLVRGLNGFARAATVMAVKQPMAKEVAAGFLAPYDSWKHRVAIHRFVQDIPMESSHPSWQTLLSVERGLQHLQDCPVLVCWGGRDFCFNDAFYTEWQRRFPRAQTHYFPEASHYVLEDAGEAIVPLVQTFLSQQQGT